VGAGIAEELGHDLGLRTGREARAAITETGPWDGQRATAPNDPVPDAPGKGTVVLETWRQMIDDGRGQDGQARYRATARPAVLRANAATLSAAGVEPGGQVTIGTKQGSVSFPAEVADLPDGVVWVPANSGTNLRSIGAGHGSTVNLTSGGGDA
jgi:NADH-quinone oxidoreductase subunit G